MGRFRPSQQGANLFPVLEFRADEVASLHWALSQETLSEIERNRPAHSCPV